VPRGALASRAAGDIILQVADILKRGLVVTRSRSCVDDVVEGIRE